MEKIRKLSTAGTIICVISVIIYIVFALLLQFKALDMFWGFADNSMGKMNQIDSNSPSAGFEVLAYLAGGALGFLGGLFSILFTIFLGFLAIYNIPAIITGFIANSKYKKGNDVQACLNTYKTDGFVKAIMSGIVLSISMLLTISDLGHSSIKDVFFLIIAIWNFVAVFILSVLQLKEINQH